MKLRLKSAGFCYVRRAVELAGKPRPPAAPV